MPEQLSNRLIFFLIVLEAIIVSIEILLGTIPKDIIYLLLASTGILTFYNIVCAWAGI